MGTSRVRTLGSLIQVSGASGSIIAEGDIFEGCTPVKPESHQEKWKIKNEDNYHILSLGREHGRGSPRPFLSTFTKRCDQKGKPFDTREDSAVISHHDRFFGISI
jgi:hypothetical protein